MKTKRSSLSGRRRRSRSSTPANGDSNISSRLRGGGSTTSDNANDKTITTTDKTITTTDKTTTTTTTSSKNGRSNGPTEPSDPALSNVHYSSADMEVDEDDKLLVSNCNKSSCSNSKPDSEVQQKCKLCGVGVGVARTALASHVLEVHLTEVHQKLDKGLNCPECSFTSGEKADLASHFVSSHETWNADKSDASENESDNDSDSSEKIVVAKSATAMTNGPKTSTPGKQRRMGRKGDHDKPRNFVEFSRQVEQNLRTEDGKFATAVDERSIRCVCGKVVRTCGKYYWKYLVQRPTIKNGQVIQKGHWFTCSAVAEFKSMIPQWPVSQEDIEASKNVESSTVRRNGNVENNIEDSDVEKRRRVRKRVPVDKESDQPSIKKCRENDDESDEASEDDDDDEEEEDEDEIDPEIGETQAKYRVKKWVSDKLALRVPGEIFLQDGPCFQVILNQIFRQSQVIKFSYWELI